MAVMPAQSPERTIDDGQIQDPPTARTIGSLSQFAALASPTPPVGQNLTSGKGPADAGDPHRNLNQCD
jgi:hypothetical protein